MCRLLSMVSWLVTGLVAAHRGLDLLGYALINMQEFYTNNPGYVKPMGLLIAASGIYSLFMLVMIVFGVKRHCGCGCKGAADHNCSCK